MTYTYKGKETGRPQYLALVLADCIAPNWLDTPTPEALLKRAAERGVELTFTDAVWACRAHAGYVERYKARQ